MADESINNSWTMPMAPNTPSSGVVFMEPTLYPSSTSFLQAFDLSQPPASWSEKTSTSVCSSLDIEPCKSATQLRYKAYLPKCENETQTDCIQDFYAVWQGKKFTSEFQSYMPTSSPYHFSGDTSRNLPSGKSTSIWTLPDFVSNARSLQYAVSVILDNSTTIRTSDGILGFGAPNIEVTIDAVEIIRGRYSPPYASTNGNAWSISGCLQEGCDGDSSVSFPSNIGYCSAVESTAMPGASNQGNTEGNCAKRVNHPSNVIYGIEIRMNKTPEGWIHGRISDPKFSIQEREVGASWTIEGRPVILPVISGWIANTDLQEKIGRSPTKPEETSWSGPLSSGSNAFSTFEKWSTSMGDRAQALQERWSFRTLSWEDRQSDSPVSACFKGNTVAGMVVTNATVYQGAPPSWNAVDSTLDYKVAAPHFSSTGQEFFGMYQMKLNTSFAKCLYGVDGNQIKATISVISPDGVPRAATTSLTTTAGWFDFYAAGFNFSAPIVRVRLDRLELPPPQSTSSTQEANSSEEVIQQTINSEDSQNKKAVVKVLKRTVTCVKGGVKLKMAGKKAKCPKGYQRS